GSICVWANRPGSTRPTPIVPIGSPSLSIGTARRLRKPLASHTLFERVRPLVEQIGNLCDRTCPDGPTSGAAVADSERVHCTDRLVALRIDALKSGQADQLAIVELYLAIGRSAQAARTPRDDVEHWLGVGLGAADGVQDFRRRRLLVERRREITVAHLQLFEQPHVLDRDDGLVGEGFHERYLLVG